MKTPVPSPYPVLDNRPIDQWKVTELKEELKRRKLTTRGLKEDLVRRLDDALRSDMDAADVEANNDNGVKGSEADSVVSESPVAVSEEPVVVKEGSYGVTEELVCVTEEHVGITEEPVSASVEPFAVTAEPTAVTAEPTAVTTEPTAVTVEPTAVTVEPTAVTVDPVIDAADSEVVASGNIEEAMVTGDANAIPIEVDFSDSSEQLGQSKSFDEKEPGLVNDPASGLGMEISTDGPAMVVSEAKSGGPLFGNPVGRQDLEEGKSERDNGDSRAQLAEDIKPPHEDVKLDSSAPFNQVSEVSSSLGFPVKSNNSISTDSLSINEKNGLKDNIIADNVKLESDVKPEMVQPSSSDLVADSGRSHPTDVDEPRDNKVSVEETDNTVANVDMSQKNTSADLGSSEKLNLDRSSGDDSMEEDALESKQIDSKYNAEEVEGKSEISEITIVKAESLVATMDTDLPLENEDIHEKNVLSTSSDKRKLSDQEVALKPAKRQHRWKTDISVSEPQILDIPPEAPSKYVPSPATLKRSFSRSDSTGANEPPKEREVPPSMKPATNSLRIDRFLRPFTLKAVQELLGKTGTVASFWMDHIKTHCYVTYSSVEEATETRNAVYNLQWPPNGGRQLVAEFVEPEEVKLRVEPPTQPPVQPVASAPIKAPEPPLAAQPSPRQQNVRQQMAEQPTLPPPPALSNQIPAKELALPPPPPRNEKVDAPIVTLDDLFRKTKATPRIYYLPLSEERVSAILEERRKKAKQ